TDKVRFQGQEVAAVVAEDPYIAKDALELIDVDYEPLEAVTTPQRALEADAPIIRTDKEDQKDNHIYDWEAGDKDATDRAFAVATAASLLIGRPVKWVEERTENLISTGFARDYHMLGELALKEDGTMLGLRVSLLSDNGAFFSDAQPTKFKAGLFHIVTGSYDVAAAHVEADGAYTNKAPGGVAYRCSFRVTEASYLIERLVENAALEMKMDPADI